MRVNHRTARTMVLGNRTLFDVSRAAYRIFMRAYYHTRLTLDRDRAPYYNVYLYVDPHTIRQKTKIDSNKFLDVGKMRPGDWDLDVISFQDTYPYYGSLRSVLLDGARWEDTPLFQIGMERIRSGDTAWGCRNPSELTTRVGNIASLFATIRDHGYARPAHRTFTGLSDEVSVHVGRRGDLLFEDGGHRLTMAQLLNVKRIPVQVTLRHTTWAAFRRQHLPDGSSATTETSHAQTHPDISAVYECTSRPGHPWPLTD